MLTFLLKNWPVAACSIFVCPEAVVSTADQVPQRGWWSRSCDISKVCRFRSTLARKRSNKTAAMDLDALVKNVSIAKGLEILGWSIYVLYAESQKWNFKQIMRNMMNNAFAQKSMQVQILQPIPFNRNFQCRGSVGEVPGDHLLDLDDHDADDAGNSNQRVGESPFPPPQKNKTWC